MTTSAGFNAVVLPGDLAFSDGGMSVAYLIGLADSILLRAARNPTASDTQLFAWNTSTHRLFIRQTNDTYTMVPVGTSTSGLGASEVLTFRSGAADFDSDASLLVVDTDTLDIYLRGSAGYLRIVNASALVSSHRAMPYAHHAHPETVPLGEFRAATSGPRFAVYGPQGQINIANRADLDGSYNAWLRAGAMGEILDTPNHPGRPAQVDGYRVFVSSVNADGSDGPGYQVEQASTSYDNAAHALTINVSPSEELNAVLQSALDSTPGRVRWSLSLLAGNVALGSRSYYDMPIMSGAHLPFETTTPRVSRDGDPGDRDTVLRGDSRPRLVLGHGLRWTGTENDVLEADIHRGLASLNLQVTPSVAPKYGIAGTYRLEYNNPADVWPESLWAEIDFQGILFPSRFPVRLGGISFDISASDAHLLQSRSSLRVSVEFYDAVTGGNSLGFHYLGIGLRDGGFISSDGNVPASEYTLGRIVYVNEHQYRTVPVHHDDITDITFRRAVSADIGSGINYLGTYAINPSLPSLSDNDVWFSLRANHFEEKFTIAGRALSRTYPVANYRGRARNEQEAEALVNQHGTGTLVLYQGEIQYGTRTTTHVPDTYEFRSYDQSIEIDADQVTGGRFGYDQLPEDIRPTEGGYQYTTVWSGVEVFGNAWDGPVTLTQAIEPDAEYELMVDRTSLVDVLAGGTRVRGQELIDLTALGSPSWSENTNSRSTFFAARTAGGGGFNVYLARSDDSQADDAVTGFYVHSGIGTQDNYRLRRIRKVVPRALAAPASSGSPVVRYTERTYYHYVASGVTPPRVTYDFNGVFSNFSVTLLDAPLGTTPPGQVLWLVKARGDASGPLPSVQTRVYPGFTLGFRAEDDDSTPVADYVAGTHRFGTIFDEVGQVWGPNFPIGAPPEWTTFASATGTFTTAGAIAVPVELDLDRVTDLRIDLTYHTGGLSTAVGRRSPFYFPADLIIGLNGPTSETPDAASTIRLADLVNQHGAYFATGGPVDGESHEADIRVIFRRAPGAASNSRVVDSLYVLPRAPNTLTNIMGLFLRGR